MSKRSGLSLLWAALGVARRRGRCHLAARPAAAEHPSTTFSVAADPIIAARDGTPAPARTPPQAAPRRPVCRAEHRRSPVAQRHGRRCRGVPAGGRLEEGVPRPREHRRGRARRCEGHARRRPVPLRVSPGGPGPRGRSDGDGRRIPAFARPHARRRAGHTPNDLIPVGSGPEPGFRRAFPCGRSGAGPQHHVSEGDLTAAKTAWLTAHLTYETLGAAYGAFGDLDTAINGSPAPGHTARTDPASPDST